MVDEESRCSGRRSWRDTDDNNNTDDPTRFLVDFDVEWKSEIGHEDNPVTVLQLGVDQRCLIFQIFHCDAIRNALFNFLSDLHRVQDPRERSEADIGLQCQGWEHNGDKDIVGRAGISEAGRTKAGEEKWSRPARWHFHVWNAIAELELGESGEDILIWIDQLGWLFGYDRYACGAVLRNSDGDSLLALAARTCAALINVLGLKGIAQGLKLCSRLGAIHHLKGMSEWGRGYKV
ncbi:hypothetical protein QJS10_CPA08g00465 [Acorus calamus]|uniref:Uncharacterized protein n=1 Tax=Acorus calamus TaxID=4465 RepID=A0AAV9EH22_ACOCL|nr:hypothetical protein QJS10_CPA08g00465 [Acorus calamus]